MAEGGLARSRLDGLVPRPRLLERLEQSRTPVVVLDAPTGYGKSVLLAQWADRDRRPFVSIALRAAHNDPVVLIEAVLDALEQFEPVPTEIASALAVPEPDIEGVVLPRLEQALEAREAAGVLVIEELEQIESADSQAVVRSLVKHARAGFQVAIATRSEPSLPLGRLRANRLLTEIGRAELAMRKTECQMLLAGLDFELAPRDLDALFERTEGWPAAIYLAGIALLDEVDIRAAIARFAGDDRIVADYIRDEFLAPASKRQLELLRRVSILDRFDGTLCDAVLERSGSGKALRDLARGNMLLLSLDRRDEWFRLHTLLAGMLRAELRRVEPEIEPQLHLRASEWWAEQGDTERAIEHAIAADAFERAGELIWAAAPDYYARGRNATMRRWLERIGEERIATLPSLSIAAAQGSLGRGEGGMTDHWIAVSRRLLADHNGPVDGSLTAGLSLAEAAIARGSLISMSERAAAASAVIPDESPWLSMCCLMDGSGLLLRGRLEQANERLVEGGRRGAIAAPHVQVLCLSQLALLAIEEPDWQVAEILASQARAQIERSGLGDYITAALAFAVSAFVRSRRGMAAEAAADLHAGVRLMRRLDEFAAWYEVETRVVLARAAARLDEVGLAQDLLDEARRLIQLTPEASLLSAWLEKGEKEAETISAAAVSDLTPAELRILGYLPTHHSFPQIAKQTNVSPNTVKTQAQAVYRKLGVTSRREAVEHARSVGLLGGDERGR
jgi:LuxR family transcriptional regulator, maltose regulon positive regulatory protein